MRIGVYAGSFDPITWGHLSVVERAASLFDQLLVVIAVNPNKVPLFSLEERLALNRAVLAPWSNVACTSTDGFVVDLATSCGATYLVRGVRDATDVVAELELAHANQVLAPQVETLFVPAKEQLAAVSSSRLKDLARAGADLSAWCPSVVAERLRTKFGREASDVHPT